MFGGRLGIGVKEFLGSEVSVHLEAFAGAEATGGETSGEVHPGAGERRIGEGEGEGDGRKAEGEGVGRAMGSS